MPLWDLLPALSLAFPDLTISSTIKNNAAVLSDLKTAECTLAVLPYDPASEEYICIPYLKENLFISVAPEHVPAKYTEVSFSDLNGHNFLLAPQLGFWYDLCLEKMPASRFHVQADEAALKNLILNSSLPGFVTDLSAARRTLLPGCIAIPITDPDKSRRTIISSDRCCREMNPLNTTTF